MVIFTFVLNLYKYDGFNDRRGWTESTKSSNGRLPCHNCAVHYNAIYVEMFEITMTKHEVM